MLKKNFDQYIVYYKPTRTADSYGQVKETWAEYQKAFVNYDRYAGGETVRSERIEWTGNIYFTGHYISTIDTTYKILYNGDYYAILDIEYIERKRWMRIRVEKIID